MADPLRNFKFKVEIVGLGAMGFSKATGLNASVEVIEYREGMDKLTARKFPGQVSYENVTLERGMTVDSDLVDWINAVYNPDLAPDAVNGGTVYRNVTISVMQKNGVTARQFILTNAFVAKRTITDLDASANEILIESLELAHSGMSEVKFSDTGTAR